MSTLTKLKGPQGSLLCGPIFIAYTHVPFSILTAKIASSSPNSTNAVHIGCVKNILISVFLPLEKQVGREHQ